MRKFSILSGIAGICICGLSSGCTTLVWDGGDSAQEQDRVANLQQEVRALQTQVAETRAAQQDIYRRMEQLDAGREKEQRDTQAALERMDQMAKADEAARAESKRAIVAEISKKMADLMKGTPAPSPAGRNETGYEHVVKAGETLSKIAAAYGISPNAIISANNLKNPHSLRAGQKLFIPESGSSTSPRSSGRAGQ